MTLNMKVTVMMYNMAGKYMTSYLMAINKKMPKLTLGVKVAEWSNGTCAIRLGMSESI